MQPIDVARHLVSVEIRSPADVDPPKAGGVYAWWCRRDRLAAAVPAFPYEARAPASSDWSLLYVGISPNSPFSSRNIAIRFARDHTGGTIRNSTFRQSIASLTMGSLMLQPLRGRDRSRLVSELPLSRWIEASCGVTFAAAPRPWELELEIIRLLNPPLNIAKGTHPFRLEVSVCRAALRQACGLGS